MVVVAPPVLQMCDELWYDPEELANTITELSAEDAEYVVRQATISLFMLTGERFHGPQCLVEEYRIRPGQNVLRLRKFPIDEVVSVETVASCNSDGGTVLTGWCPEPGGDLRLTPSYSGTWGFTGCNSSRARIVRIKYRVSSNLPMGADRATMRMAREYANLFLNKKSCLPERVTNVDRNGVSFTIVDPLEFMDNRRTGIADVDRWLHVQNGRALVQMIDPVRSGILLQSRVVGCSEDCDPLDEEIGS